MQIFETIDGKRRLKKWVLILAGIILFIPGAIVIYYSTIETEKEKKQNTDSSNVVQIKKDNFLDIESKKKQEIEKKINEEISKQEEYYGRSLTNTEKEEIKNKILEEDEAFKKLDTVDEILKMKNENIIENKNINLNFFKREEYIPIRKRLGLSNNQTQQMEQKQQNYLISFNKPDVKQEENKKKEKNEENESKFSPTRIHIGYYLPCILESDIITTDLSNMIWAILAEDVILYGKKILEKGKVKFRGRTAVQPNRNFVDIFFDLALFTDGKEEGIVGYAYSANLPEYPNTYKVRGIPGEIITPPLWKTLQEGLITAVTNLGKSINYNQNTNNEYYGRLNPYGEGINMGIEAGQNVVKKVLDKTIKKEEPYIFIPKGTPFYIQLYQSFDIAKRDYQKYEKNIGEKNPNVLMTERIFNSDARNTLNLEPQNDNQITSLKISNEDKEKISEEQQLEKLQKQQEILKRVLERMKNLGN